VGGQVARLAQALGMVVCAWSRNLTAVRCDALGVAMMPDLGSLMRKSDVVSVHLVLSPRTAGLIGADALTQARDGQVLINTSRGGIVDSRALLAALHRGRPARAALDVFDEEPLPPGHPLLDRALIEDGRLLLTPHLGYATEQTFRLFYSQTAAAVRAFMAGSPLRVIDGA
jgi:phosphoglycerate dehydrogenase-like enzyme